MVSTAQITRPRFAQLIIGLVGALYLFTSIAQIIAPMWFYREIGTFPPYNRHFIGDLGSFLLPLGVGLLIASFNPAKHMLLIGVAAFGGLLHSLNHLYDTLNSHATLEHWISDTIPLLLVGALLLFVYANTKR